MINKKFQLLLFSIDKQVVLEAVKSGIDAIVVDCEFQGKKRRQLGMETEVNNYSIDDLKRVRKMSDVYIICRINNRANGEEMKTEIDHVISAGANEILLPMVRTVEEIDAVRKYINNRVQFSILIETKDAVSISREIGELDLARVYVGLNDLAIDCDYPNIFTALENGVIDEIRRHIKVPFGFAGLTDPRLGFPIPCHLLISEMVRLNCSFTFLRRSFLRDVSIDRFYEVIPKINKSIAKARTQHGASLQLVPFSFQ